MKGFAYQIVIATTAEKAFTALTKPEFTQKFWFGRSLDSDWKLGSAVTIVTPEGKTEMTGKVLEYTPNSRLSYTWSSSERPQDPVTTVVFELQEMGPLVKLSILQDLDAESAAFQQAAAGWTFILNGLKTLLETGSPMPALPWKKA